MTAAVDAAVVSDACSALGVTEVGPIGATGGQKTVRHVRRGNDDLVLKVIAVSSSSPAMLTRAEREVSLLRVLGSPNVVRVESDLVRLGSPTSGAAWLEEFLDGDDLRALLGPQWSWADAAEMGRQVAEGLAAGHAKGVIHRDLSPNNIRRCADGSYRVMDFGFARFTLRSGVTVGGQPGTYGYHSPEHLRGFSGVPMPASDVFGVGVLMYEALTGAVPIPHTGDEADYQARLSAADVLDLGALRPDLTNDQVALMKKALHPQPARRFRDGRKLADALAVTP